MAVALGQESRILDGDGSQVGEHAQQAELVIGEAGQAQAGEHDDADDATFRAQGRQQHRLLEQVERAGHIDGARVGVGVGDVEGLAGEGHPAGDALAHA